MKFLIAVIVLAAMTFAFTHLAQIFLLGQVSMKFTVYFTLAFISILGLVGGVAYRLL